MDFEALELLERQLYIQLEEGGYKGRINKVSECGVEQLVEPYNDLVFWNVSVPCTIYEACLCPFLPTLLFIYLITWWLNFTSLKCHRDSFLQPRPLIILFLYQN